MAGEVFSFRGQEWVARRTRKGDTLAKLAAAYQVPARDIVEANGIPYQNDHINQWVKNIGGTCMPYKEGQPKVVGCADGGWAVFTDSTTINLPNRKRIDVPDIPTGPPAPAGPIMSQVPSGGTPWLLVGALAIGAGALYLRSRKKGRGRRVPAPVQF